MERFRLKRLWLLVPGAVALVLTRLAQGNPGAADAMFSRGIYPWISSAWGFLPSLAPFSVAQWAVVAFLVFCIGWLAFYVIAFVRDKGERGLVVWKALATLLAVVSVGYFTFALMCGLNYYRHTFAEEAGFTLQESTTDELTTLCESLAENVNETRDEVAEAVEGPDSASKADGVANAQVPDVYAESRGGFWTYSHETVANMQVLAEKYPALSRPLYSPPKPVLFSELLSYADIAGMYFPFTVESNINTDGPFFTIPATMGHEMAHQCGFMREDEANFIGYLVCKDAADPLTRYSGYSLAYDYAIGALNRVDHERAIAINDTLSEAVKADRRARSEYLKQFEGPVAEASNAANNAYLKANQQTDGTRSYGRMVDLLLAEQRAR
ncbi:DUF3810 domain-containing protein [Adlercreutzia shanghongiae]|uniref:DUF3810 domain-containing protein n=1 Tax=Adlercreutzia shanghongiae TaxID=3111773 RepID=A0ABU6IZX2_9ACTN|nr:DUF3810 domain-containing protein [Adlercreutzia sp. R22]MEC4295437.1 DUF3810 domain-containing protein [Adlercreutzia sp. R22]